MAQIIPAINAETWEEVVRKIRIVEPHGGWVHIDVADGTFTPNSLWHDPQDLVGFKAKCQVEIHLMADRPEVRVGSWLITPVQRIIVHQEVLQDFDLMLSKCREAQVQLGIAADSHTPADALVPFAASADLLQVLAVHAGKGGQEFERHNIEKIKHLRASAPEAIIEVDGGINAETAKLVKDAGANIVVSASYILDNQNPKAKYEELSRL